MNDGLPRRSHAVYDRPASAIICKMMGIPESQYRFDVRRHPNEHVGFGGPGPHFCLGAHLAWREITVMFREIFERVPDLQVTGEPNRLTSFFIHGLKHMRCEFTPGGARA